MITIEVNEKISQSINDFDFPIDPLNELDPITLGLRKYLRHHNHKVELKQGNEKVEILFDPELNCNIELFPALFYSALGRMETDITFAYWPIILHVKKENNTYFLNFNFSKSTDILTEYEFKILLLGFAEKIAIMAKENNYLTKEQVTQFLTGKF